MWLCLKHEIPLIATSGGGAIVNTGSTAAIRPTPMSPIHYSAAKAGVLHLTRIAAAQYAKDRIRVNSVSPGLTKSAEAGTSGQMDALVDKMLIKRPNRPVDIANAVLWLCSEEAAMVTG